MAPTKKKKKPQSNPARGFATTSVTSKSQAVVAAAAAAEAKAAAEKQQQQQVDTASPGTSQSQVTANVSTDVTVQELSSEKVLESQLRELVDKYGPKCRKEAQRWIDRLQTERRMYRSAVVSSNTASSTIPSGNSVGSTFPLYIEGLLGLHRDEQDFDTDCLGKRIFDLAREEAEAAWGKAGGRERKLIRSNDGKGEQVVLQSWMLYRIFMGLGFDERKVEKAVEEVMGKGKVGLVSAEYEKLPGVVLGNGGGGLAGEDVHVGLMEEMLDWLVVESLEEELPRYDGAVRGKEKEKENEKEKELSPTSPQNEQQENKQLVRAAQVGEARRRNQGHKIDMAVRPAHGAKKIPILQAPIPQLSTMVLEPLDMEDAGAQAEEILDTPSEEHKAPTSGKGMEGESDEDEDVSPEDLLPKWIELRRRLYLIDPSFFNSRSSKKKNTASKVNDPMAKQLHERIMKIEKDPFFDTRKAGEIWEKERVLLSESSKVQATSGRGRGGRKKKEDWWVEKDVAIEQQPEKVEQEVRDDGGEEDVGLFGRMFDGARAEEVVGPSQEKIEIRDFEEAKINAGKMKFEREKKLQTNATAAGTVRKVVEEVVKARDVNAKVTYAITHGTTYSSRHSLTIKWSNPTILDTFLSSADLPSSATPFHPPSAPDVAVTSHKPHPTVTFQMTTLAAATSAQSEAYISTFALYHLYGGSVTSSGRGYMRLQGVWRALWQEFVERDKWESEKLEKEILGKLKKLVVDEDSGEAAQDIFTVQTAKLKRIKEIEETEVGTGSGESSEGDTSSRADWEKHAKGENLKEEWEQRVKSQAYLEMLEYRKNLPMWAFKEEVLNALDQEQIIIICGETGCGKSTQVPAFILENELSHGRLCRVYCTEPRRISAISLARRVSQELGETRSDIGGRNSLVGYAIRLESCISSWTRVIYATTGIVMRMLEKSPELDDVTHLVLDEVHERSIDSDFLLIILKKLLLKRKDLKVILMSATVDAEKFSKYLNNAPILNVPGRTFPVKAQYLEDAIELTKYKVPENYNGRKSKLDDEWDDGGDFDDQGNNNISYSLLGDYSHHTKVSLSRFNEYEIPYELIVRLIETISTHPEYQFYSKAILVFLPGIAEIRKLNDYLLGHPVFGGYGAYGEERRREWLIYPLHSTIASEEQEAAFLLPPPGVRKIVLATNIAETGITIPDVTCVIDSGKHKEMRFDERRQLSRLIETFVSKANAKQRRGRAGRVQEGLCFHLFTKERHDNWMSDQQQPEMTRLSLQDLVLRVKICKLGAIEEILTSALDPPLPRNIRRAIDSLIEVKALTSTEELTPLGRQLAKLPLDVYLGKLVLYGWINGCLDAAITIAAMLSSKSPFFAPMGMRKEADAARMVFKRGDSDLLTNYAAYCSWRRVCQGTNMTEAQFCRKNYLSARTLSAIEDLKGQLIACIVDAGFLVLTPEERAALNRSRFQFRRKHFFTLPYQVDGNSEKDNIITSVIAAGFYPKLLVKDGRGWRNVANNQSVQVHPGSVNRGNQGSTWLSYYGIMQSSRFYDAHETSHVDDIVIALLCGDIEFKLYAGTAIIDGHRIKFAFQEWKSILAIKILRNRLVRLVNRAFKRGGGGGGGKVIDIGDVGRLWLEIAWDVVLGRNRRVGSAAGSGAQ